MFHPGQAGPVFPPVFPGQPGPQYVTVERLSGQISHHSPAGSSTSTLRQGQIPTTILELSAQEPQPQSYHQQQSQPQPQAPERRSRSERERESGARPRENKTGKSRKSGAEQDFDSWDYVYKHLQQTGYNKDQAERPDVLERNNSQSEEELRRNIQELRLRDSARNGESSQHRHHGGGGEAGRRGRPREQSQTHRHSRVLVETSGSEVEQDNSRYSSALSEETHQHQHHNQPTRQHRWV